MKICIVSNGEATDPKNWSGTPYNIAARLKEYNDIEVCSLNLKKLIKHPIYDLFRRTIGKFVFLKGSPRDPMLYLHDSKIIAEKLQEIGADINLYCAEYCVRGGAKTDAQKNYAYVDATLRPLLEADPKKKLGTNIFLSGYEKNERACYALLDGVFTMNEWTIESAQKLYGAEKSKFTNVGFGINASYYLEEKSYADNHLLIILRKGTEYYKGLDLLLEAFVIAQKKVPDLRLSVVGTDYKQVEGVTYYYNQPRDVTLRLLREATLYVMPSVREPNGITYLEALANKTPIIGMDRFAFPEFCGNGKYGWVVNEFSAYMLAETICEALSDKDRLKMMGDEGQKFVAQKYNWDEVVKKMMEVFKNRGDFDDFPSGRGNSGVRPQ